MTGTLALLTFSLMSSLFANRFSANTFWQMRKNAEKGCLLKPFSALFRLFQNLKQSWRSFDTEDHSRLFKIVTNNKRWQKKNQDDPKPILMTLSHDVIWGIKTAQVFLVDLFFWYDQELSQPRYIVCNLKTISPVKRMLCFQEDITYLCRPLALVYGIFSKERGKAVQCTTNKTFLQLVN